MNTRRNFLKKSITSIAAVSPLMGILSSLEKLEASDVTGEYKAIVCVFVEGGCDAFNMIVPSENTAYDDYAAVRGSIALDQDTLLSFSHSNSNGLNPLSYGMRDNMSEMKTLFDDNELAIIANIGTLVKPVTQSEVENGSQPIPSQLFSHNTQRAQWMMGNAKDIELSGWAGRASDVFYPSANPYFNITVNGSNLMQSGGSVESLEFKEAAISPDTMEDYGFGPDAGGGDLGKVYQDIYNQQETASHKLFSTFAQRRLEKLSQQITLKNLFNGVQDFNFSKGVHETGVSLGEQLKIVAQILSVKDNFPGSKKRQIFFVNHHGWDTHDSDNEHQVDYLSQSLGTFNAALKTMGIENNVTTFTISDFGRSLTSNGVGTDHGWGNHAFVMGGAVKGGDIYGTMPEIKKNSPDAWSDRVIPTTSIETYFATIVKWFGATNSELDTIFPNLNAFSEKDMEFMKTT